MYLGYELPERIRLKYNMILECNIYSSKVCTISFYYSYLLSFVSRLYHIQFAIGLIELLIFFMDIDRNYRRVMS